MFKTLVTKLKSFLNSLNKPKEPTPALDTIHISFFKTCQRYPNGENQIDMYYQGHLVDKGVNEWSVVCLVNDILAAKYDALPLESSDSKLFCALYNIKHSRSVDVKIDSMLTVRFVFTFFTDEKTMMDFHRKISPFANDPAAKAFMEKM